MKCGDRSRRTVRLKMARITDLMLCIFYHNSKEIDLEILIRKKNQTEEESGIKLQKADQVAEEDSNSRC